MPGTYSKLLKSKASKPTKPKPKKKSVSISSTAGGQKSKVVKRRDSTIARNQSITQSINHDSVLSATHQAIEIIRASVKKLGKESNTLRLNNDEKEAISQVVYNYKSEGIKTSENEIARIAINYIIWDFEYKDKGSILAQVLKALNS